MSHISHYRTSSYVDSLDKKNYLMFPTEISENLHLKRKLFNTISTKDNVGIIQRGQNLIKPNMVQRV